MIDERQRAKLINDLTQDIISGMDMGSLYSYAFEQMSNYFDSLNENTLLEEAENHYGVEKDEIIKDFL